MDYLVKAFIFTIFLTMVYFVIDHFIDILKNAVIDLPFSGYLCQFGIYQGLTVFISILASAFAFKQILNFLK